MNARPTPRDVRGSATADASWGTTIERRRDGIPFLAFRERPANLVQVLEETARWADRTLVRQDGLDLTYADLLERSRLWAAALVEAGVGPGDRVIMIGFNSADWVVSFWAVLRTGATIVLGNAWWSGAEIMQAIADVDPHCLVADRRTLEALGNEDASRTQIPPIVISFADLRERGARSRGAAEIDSATSAGLRVREDEPAVVLFTSGTSGRPKGAVLTHLALIAMQHMLLYATRRLPQHLPPDFDAAVTLQTGPVFHIGGIQALLRTMITGGLMVFPRGKFDPTEVLDLIESEGVHRWGGVPTMITRVLGEPDIDRRDLTSVTSLTLGGSMVQPNVLARIKRHFPNVTRGVGQIYGLSEAGGTLCSASGRDLVDRPDSVGRAMPLVELRIENPDETGTGPLLARTPTQMNGYFGQELDPSLGVGADGWLRTGDLARIADDGYVYLMGRAKDIIIRGGENVAAAHVEAALLEHPAVSEAAVFGIPDEDLGELVAAAVVVCPGVDVAESDLEAAVSAKLGRFQVPTRWWIGTDALPTNDVGKIDKKLVARRYGVVAASAEVEAQR